MATATHAQGHRVESPPLDRGVRTVVAIVVLGAITTVLDATIVSVAIETLADRFNASLATIQWVMTGYLLAMAAVIPVTGWAADRYGGKRVWMVSVTLFITGSVLSGIAWSAQSLIVFRVLQGLGGGMVVPVGMTLVAQAAGPQRMGRAMSLVGIPMMLGPVLGPVLGGVLVSTVSWRWIFLLNLPIGVLTLLWSRKALANSPGRRTDALDVTGLLLLSPGLAALVYGVSTVAQSGGLTRPEAAAGVFGGLALLGLFLAHALRTERPLLDLRHFAHRTFSAAATIQFLMGAVLIGSMLLLPLYYQLVRGESAWSTGLLLVPQGVGAALALSLTGRLVDRGHGKTVVLAGVPLLSVGVLAYTQSGPHTSYPLLLASLLVMGLGTGCLMAPVTAAAYAVLDRTAIPRATAALNIIQRTGGVLGAAAYAVILQHHLDHLDGPAHTASGAAIADAFADTFWWPLTLAALIIVPALLLPRRRQSSDDTAPEIPADPS